MYICYICRTNEFRGNMDIVLLVCLMWLRDHSYSRWEPHLSVISAISSEGLVANYILPAEQRFNNEAFIAFLDHCLPLMNVYNGVNVCSVIVMGELQQRF